MLIEAPPDLPVEVNITLLADRGFGHTELMQIVTGQLGWHYRIRLKSTTRV